MKLIVYFDYIIHFAIPGICMYGLEFVKAILRKKNILFSQTRDRIAKKPWTTHANFVDKFDNKPFDYFYDPKAPNDETGNNK